MPVKPLNLIATGDKDASAIDLAGRIGGTASVRIEGYSKREFDTVNDIYIAQTTNSLSATQTPSNYLNRSRKAQIRETLRIAVETNRTALFEFTAGQPSVEVAAFIQRNAERVAAKYEISVHLGDANVTGNN